MYDIFRLQYFSVYHTTCNCHQKEFECRLVIISFVDLPILISLNSLMYRGFVKVGVNANSMGVITPYQAQVQLLKSMLTSTDIEVNTVDQYQGRDKSVIIISFARTVTNVGDHNKKVRSETFLCKSAESFLFISNFQLV